MVDRSSFSSCSLFHARGAATEKALSPIRRRVRNTTKPPDDEARSGYGLGLSIGWTGLGRVGSNFWQLSWVGFNNTVMDLVQRLHLCFYFSVRAKWKTLYFKPSVTKEIGL